MTAPKSGEKTLRVFFMTQFRHGNGDWQDLSKWASCEEAAGRVVTYQATWDALRDRAGMPDEYQVICHQVIDEVAVDPAACRLLIEQAKEAPPGGEVPG